MKYDTGFIALGSVLVLSAVFLLVAIGIAERGIHSTQSTLSAAQGERAAALSRGCADYALAKLTQDLHYTGDETLSIEGEACDILPIEVATDGSRTVRTRSTVSGHAYRVIVEIGSLEPEPVVEAYRSVTAF